MIQTLAYFFVSLILFGLCTLAFGLYLRARRSP